MRLFSRMHDLVMLAILNTTALPAQGPATEAGARAAAIQWWRTEGTLPTSTPVVSDLDAVRQALTRCDTLLAGPPVCRLADEKLVGWMEVRMITPTSAWVEYRTYRVVRHSCPAHPDAPELPEPVVSYQRTAQQRMVYADGRWAWDGRARVTMC